MDSFKCDRVFKGRRPKRGNRFHQLKEHVETKQVRSSIGYSLAGWRDPVVIRRPEDRLEERDRRTNTVTRIATRVCVRGSRGGGSCGGLIFLGRIFLHGWWTWEMRESLPFYSLMRKAFCDVHQRGCDIEERQIELDAAVSGPSAPVDFNLADIEKGSAEMLEDGGDLFMGTKAVLLWL